MFARRCALFGYKKSFKLRDGFTISMSLRVAHAERSTQSETERGVGARRGPERGDDDTKVTSLHRGVDDGGTSLCVEFVDDRRHLGPAKHRSDDAIPQYRLPAQRYEHLAASFVRALGRRLRRTDGWIFIIQAIAYYGKLAIHPLPLVGLIDLWERAAIGPIPGAVVVTAGPWCSPRSQA